MPCTPGEYRVIYDGKETVAHYTGKIWLLCGYADPFKEKDFESIGERIGSENKELVEWLTEILELCNGEGTINIIWMRNRIDKLLTKYSNENGKDKVRG